MGGLNGQRIHEASYTNVNQFEEIRSISLVPSKSLSFVVDQLKGVAKSLEENGHPPCSLLYTDNPQGMYLHRSNYRIMFMMLSYPLAEQKFHETITPSLAQGVEHLTLWSNLPVFVLPEVKTIYTSDTFTMESICSDILEQVQQRDTQLMVIAIAVQLSNDRKVKAIQIRKDDCNIVFNVSLNLILKFKVVI